MRRKLSFLSVLALLGACDNISGLPLLQKDSGAVQDAGTPPEPGKDASAPSGPLVRNPGAACADDSECEGPAAVCQTSFGGGIGAGVMPITFPDGYCTAACTKQEECAVGSECGVKKLIDTIEPFLRMSGTTIPPGLLDMIPSQCLDLCSTNKACREGYKCQSLIDASGLGAQLPIPTQFLSRYCLPPAPMLPRPPTTMDAGSDVDAAQPTSDASVSPVDAAVSDAGSAEAVP